MSDDQPHDKTVVTQVAPALAARPAARDCALIMIYGVELGKRHAIGERPVFIGRSSKCEIQIDHESISRSHASLTPTERGVVFRDLGSTNGSYVNDARVEECVLKDGDQVQVGRTIFKFLSSTNIEAEFIDQMYALATVDGLTRVHNKRFFEEELRREFGRAQRHARPLSLIMFDLDHFKQVNDSYGHHAGDQVLRQICAVIRGRIRREDIFARVGGEEFAILLPESDLASARMLADKIRALVEATTFLVDDTRLPVTISVGVGTTTGEYAEPDDFVRAVDERLYEAKRTGRNRVC